MLGKILSVVNALVTVLIFSIKSCILDTELTPFIIQSIDTILTPP